ncbi:ATP-binding cassette domain-containing protein [Paenibacillus polymyxa]|uniref:Lipid A export ATP-binding/permease protein msbA n=2 Tax=Paenibacillus polymyxa TaxID=1406 RepID=A0A0F6EQP2_PAEPO|nr:MULTISPECIES: ABC transporter ATP-binding protein [Paenibacillus]AHM67574.1 multidrug ABC transporter ATPase [Paenibacillus polymyxa SQR-21]AIY08306.1 multidrug ABC transporter ATPase [Paenibacillus polymyxa]KAF6655628.1 ABC transporter ATP-binding protein [Paenibacillus sp. EKM301P]MBE3650122.1 ABC transporter ATP-binding protein [Paenibacillus polymyxa]MBE7898479.1 ABC transporter ATP-binding protein [Paenibacillus polymyxa]
MIVLEYLKKYLSKTRKYVFFYIVVTSVLWIIGIIVPYITGIYIDYLVSKSNISIILYFVLLLGIINIVNILIQYLTALFSTKLNNLLLYEICNDIYQKIFKTKLSVFKDKDNAYLVDQINNDSSTVVDFFSNNISNLVLQVITIIISGIIVLKADVLLCVIIFSLIPFYIFTYVVFRKKLYKANLKYKKEANEYYSKKVEQINKLVFIKKNVLFNEMNERLNKAFNSLFRVATSQVKTNYIFSNLNQFILIICYIFVIGIGGHKVVIGQMSIGQFTIINTYLSMIISSTSYLLSLASSYQETKVSIERLNDVMNSENDIYGSTTLEDLEKISIKQLGVKYSEESVFRDFSYDFFKGGIYGICGHNGSGKTTLLNTLIGLYSDLYTGEIAFNNCSIKDIDMLDMRRYRISYVEQNPEFLNLPIKEYLKFGITFSKEIASNQDELITAFGLEEIITKANLENILINENGSNFSGGEKQKLALIRALSKDSFLTILDEPTSALDSKSVSGLIEILTKQKSRRITIVVSHDQRLLAACDHILNIETQEERDDIGFHSYGVL